MALKAFQRALDVPARRREHARPARGPRDRRPASGSSRSARASGWSRPSTIRTAARRTSTASRRSSSTASATPSAPSARSTSRSTARRPTTRRCRSSSQFYRDAGDMTSVRVHLNRVAGTMRARVANDPKDGVAYRVIARAMAARAAAGVDGSLPIARAAAELADAARRRRRARAHAARRAARASTSRRCSAPRPTRCCSRAACQTELRQMFRCSAIASRSTSASTCARTASAAAIGCARSDNAGRRARAGRRDRPRLRRDRRLRLDAPAVRDGRRADVSPVSLVIGQAIAQARVRDGDPVRRRRRAQARAGVARDPGAAAAADELGVLVVALLRLFQPDFPQDRPRRGRDRRADAEAPPADPDRADERAQAVRARRSTARSSATSELARDLRIAGLRAGLVASGSLMAGLYDPGGAAPRTDVPSFLADPVAQGLIAFALGEDHAAVAR